MIQMGYVSKLPNTDGSPDPSTKIVIRITAPCEFGQLHNCQVFINRELIPVNKFYDRMKGIMAEKSRMDTIFFSVDDAVNYENAVKILDEAGKITW